MDAKRMCFVFGSNLRGVHGAGAAKYAMQREGAQWGVGVGRKGNSYALPTKDVRIQSLPLSDIQQYVSMFIDYARMHPEHSFKVTRIGCGLAGFKDSQIARMFEHAPSNCFFDTAWLPHFQVLGVEKDFWGTL